MRASDLISRTTPPGVSGGSKIVSDVTGAAADSWDWVTALGTDAPKGQCLILVEALTTPVYVRFGSTATTATTTSNGEVIAAGGKAYFYVDPASHKFIDHISSGAGVIKVRVCSQIVERKYV